MAFTDHMRVIRAPFNYTVDDPEAWAAEACPSCGGHPMVVVAIAERYTSQPVLWLSCVSCGQGAVINGFEISPGRKVFPTPEGTPDAESKLWEEARACLSIGAYDAVAMICRKLLLHIVYTHQRSINPDAVPQNMNFGAAVQYLVDNEIIPKDHRIWVDTIRTTGNAANHELPDISEERATQIALFTHHLFRNIYEMPALGKFVSKYVGDAALPNTDADDD
jgi:Domain of unknown function (DUF4145)